MTRKEKLRKRFRLLRDNLPYRSRKKAAAKISQRILALLKTLPAARTVGVYIAKGSEVNTVPLIEKLLARGYSVAAPKVSVKSRALTFRRLKRGLKECRFGPYNILEPVSACPKVPPKKIDLLLVPGIAFDSKGFRLGYGMGYYDRFLRKAPRLLTCGLSYAATFVRSLPHDRRDCAVSRILTETRYLGTAVD